MNCLRLIGCWEILSGVYEVLLKRLVSLCDGGRCLFWQLNPDKSPFQQTYANQVRSLDILEG